MMFISIGQLCNKPGAILQNDWRLLLVHATCTAVQIPVASVAELPLPMQLLENPCN